MDLGVAARPEPVRGVPQPADTTRSQPSGSPGALLGRVGRNSLEFEGIDATAGIVARHFMEA